MRDNFRSVRCSLPQWSGSVKEVMPISTLTCKGQVTVPKAVRERLDLREGDTLEFNVDETGRIVVSPQRRGRGVCGVLSDFASDEPVSVEAMDQAVRRRAAEKAHRGSR